MLRGKLIARDVGANDGFRWRSREVSRVEALSDAVFGFAITLIIVSLEVPRTFGELERVVYGFVPFAISFSILVWIWYSQYQWFRHYGLEDGWTISLNVVLLFVVLFYIYPLKFLFGVLIDQFAGNLSYSAAADGVSGFVLQTDAGPLRVISNDQFTPLMLIYAVGFMAIWLVFVLLDLHALRTREALELDARELYLTRASLRTHAILVGFGALSATLALVGGRHFTPMSGWIYGFIGPVLAIHGVRTQRGWQRRERAMASRATRAERPLTPIEPPPAA